MQIYSGYTRLTEKLSTSTGAGYEALVASLNRYFDKISEEIYAHGGDVIKFAGDALLVAFYVNDEGSNNQNSMHDGKGGGVGNYLGCNYIAKFHTFPEIPQEVLSTLSSCLRCDATIAHESQRQICASCNIVCCGPCCSNEVPSHLSLDLSFLTYNVIILNNVFFF